MLSDASYMILNLCKYLIIGKAGDVIEREVGPCVLILYRALAAATGTTRTRARRTRFDGSHTATARRRRGA